MWSGSGAITEISSQATMPPILPQVVDSSQATMPQVVERAVLRRQESEVREGPRPKHPKYL